MRATPHRINTSFRFQSLALLAALSLAFITPAEPQEVGATHVSTVERAIKNDAAALGSSYADVVSRAYLSLLIYPDRAQRRGVEGVGILQVVIARNGTVQGWLLVESSGHSILDREIERVARRVSQLERLPPGFAGETATLIVPFGFTLH